MRIPKSIIAVVLIGAALIGGGFFWWKSATMPGVYDGLAQCIKDKGFSFFGAYWCPHCTQQKKLFGKSAKLLPYVECAIPGSQDMKEECKQKNIKGFPTWIGPEGKRMEGEVALDTLAKWSGCTLPK